MPKQHTIGEEMRRILQAHKDEIIDEDTAVQRLLEKFEMLSQNQSLGFQQESIRIGKIGTELQAEQNVIMKGIASSLLELTGKNKKGDKK